MKHNKELMLISVVFGLIGFGYTVGGLFELDFAMMAAGLTSMVVSYLAFRKSDVEYIDGEVRDTSMMENSFSKQNSKGEQD